MGNLNEKAPIENATAMKMRTRIKTSRELGANKTRKEERAGEHTGFTNGIRRKNSKSSARIWARMRRR